MASLSYIELIFLILQFLDEEKFKETRHKLERESGIYFNLKYFEDVVVNGKLEEAEEYLSGFTKLEENGYSIKIIFEIRKQKYLEALDKGEHAKALNILSNELKAFSAYSDSLYEDLTMLLTMGNIREHGQLASYTDAKSARVIMFAEVKRLLELNPVFTQKLQFPDLSNSRLRTLIDQRLNWQHHTGQNDDHSLDSSRPPQRDNAEPRLDLSLTLMTQVGGSSATGGLSLNRRTTVPAATRPFSSAFGNVTDSGNAPKRARPIGAPEEAPNAATSAQERRAKEINGHSQLRCLRFHASTLPVVKLLYNSIGNTIIALKYNGVHNFWKWLGTPKATIALRPEIWYPSPKARVMTNVINRRKVEEGIACCALSNDDAYLVSSSGTNLSLYNAASFKRMASVLPNPPAANCICFLPHQDNDVVAVGMEDSRILIYRILANEVINALSGHTARVTGLAFSTLHNLLVSSGMDNQLCLWNTADGWERKNSAFLLFPPGRVPISHSQTRAQFHPDQARIMVVHAAQISVYTAPRLECSRQWFPVEVGSSIADATYSCDGRSICVALQSGGIRVLSASILTLKCKINPASYWIPTDPSLSRSDIHPASIAANPTEPDQFVVGLTDGGIYLLEPKESDGKWGDEPSQLEENAASSGGVATTTAVA